MTEYARPEGPIAWAATIHGLIADDSVSAVDARAG
jgi:hypothetical protein